MGSKDEQEDRLVPSGWFPRNDLLHFRETGHGEHWQQQHHRSEQQQQHQSKNGETGGARETGKQTGKQTTGEENTGGEYVSQIALALQILLHPHGFHGDVELGQGQQTLPKHRGQVENQREGEFVPKLQHQPVEHQPDLRERRRSVGGDRSSDRESKRQDRILRQSGRSSERRRVRRARERRFLEPVSAREQRAGDNEFQPVRLWTIAERVPHAKEQQLRLQGGEEIQLPVRFPSIQTLRPTRGTSQHVRHERRAPVQDRVRGALPRVEDRGHVHWHDHAWTATSEKREHV